MALFHQFGAASQKTASEMAAELSGTVTDKPATVSKGGKKQKAPDAPDPVQAEPREPKVPFTKKREVQSIRLQGEVLEALKANGVSVSDKANELLTQYVLQQGWL